MTPTLSIKPHQETMKGSKLDVTPHPPSLLIDLFQENSS